MGGGQAIGTVITGMEKFDPTVDYMQVILGSERYFYPQDVYDLLSRPPHTFCLKCGFSGEPEPFHDGWVCGNPDCGYMVHPPSVSFTLDEWKLIKDYLAQHHVERSENGV